MIKNIGVEEQVRLWDGCQVYLGFNETSGTYASDSIGGTNGYLIGGASIAFDANGKNGYCLNIGGTDDYVNLSKVFNYEYSQPFTVSVWLKRTSTSVTSMIFSKQVEGGNYNGYCVFIGSDNKIKFGLQNTSTYYCQVATTNTFTDTTNWKHYVFVNTGAGTVAGLKIYVDGVEEAVTTVNDNLQNKTIKNTVIFAIGNRATSYGFRGYMDEFALWNRELNLAEIKALYSNGNGKFYGTQALEWNSLIHYWNFNETGGTTVYDRKGAYNGTLTNAAARSTTGKSFSGFTLSGGYYCDYGTPFTWTAAQPYSVSFWVKAASNPTNVIPIVSNINSSTSATVDIYINVNNMNFSLFYNNTSGRCFNSPTSVLTDTNWTHFLCTYNGTSDAYCMQVYKNGVPVGVIGTNTLTNTGNLGSTLYTNRRYVTSYDHASYVDEIAIFNKALTKDHAVALYNEGNGRYY